MFTQRLGRLLAVAELAKDLDWTVSSVRDARVVDGGPTEISPTSEHDPVVELINWDLVDTRLRLTQTLAGLDDDDRELLRSRYVEGLTSAEIGTRYGCSRTDVTRLLTRLGVTFHRLLGVATEDDPSV